MTYANKRSIIYLKLAYVMTLGFWERKAHEIHRYQEPIKKGRQDGADREETEGVQAAAEPTVLF